MPRQSRIDIRSPALLATSLALLAPLACGSDTGNDGDDVSTTADSFGTDNAGAGNAASGTTAGMGNSSGNPPAAATTTAPPATESPAVQNLAPAAPAPSPGASSEAASASTANAAVAPALLFAACTYSEGNYGRNCDSLYVSVKQASPARCVQLTFDNCGEYGRDSLPADVPMPWRLDSGTVGSNPEECELGEYYPSSSVALRASGSVSWNETTRLPSELVLDVALQTSTAVGAASVEVATTAPVSVSVCDD